MASIGFFTKCAIVVTYIFVRPENAFGSKNCTDCDVVNVTCVDGTCVNRCQSKTSSGECLECRNQTFYGKQCEIPCPSDCLNSLCQLNDTGPECSKGCVAGKKGVTCNVDCPTSCEHCERYGNKCAGRCRHAGHYGDYCDKRCPVNCDGGCDKDTGRCRCKTGYGGPDCAESCPANCIDGKCDRSGQCSCRRGYIGQYCNETCLRQCTDCLQTRDECKECSMCSASCLENCVTRSALVDSNIVMYVGIGLMTFAGVVPVLIGLVFYKRRMTRKRYQGSTKDGNVDKTHVKSSNCDLPVSTTCSTTTNPTYMLSGGDLQQVRYCEHLRGEQMTEMIFEEFQKLPPPHSRETKCGSLESNVMKNRYKDVLPFDETRVPLAVWEDGTNDYINASFISGYRNQIQYVAAQGPNIHVVDDFWRMIWQQNSTKIVMLTNLVEAGKIKCEMYWPFCSSDFQRYGKVCVQCVEEKVYKNHTLRTLAVWKDSAKTRTIYQFHFTSWPDHGVPDEKSIIDFHRVVKNTGYNALGPLVIHCSAGVGRSGTFIALDFLLDQARYEGRVCIFYCIQQFRYQRMKMVQTKDQYKFLYNILISALQYRGTLPRYYAPVLIECPSCWDMMNDEEGIDDDVSMEENIEEYRPLWNCGYATGDIYLPGNSKSLPRACAAISEDSPPLTSVILMEDEDEGHKVDLDNQRISWDTAL